MGFALDAPGQLAKGFKRLSRAYQRQLRQCRRRPSETPVHDLRVEARRLIALLDLLSPLMPPAPAARAHSELKCHLDCFDDLRDTQVQLRAVKSFCEHFPAAREFRRFLKKKERKLRQKARRRARKLHRKRLVNLLELCRRQAEQRMEERGVRSVAWVLLRVVGSAFAEVANLRRRVDPANAKTIHCTRIAFKKFRYMVEPLAGALDWADTPRLKRMQQYQGRMGKVQEVLRKAFEKFARKHELEAGPAVQFMEELLRRRERFVAEFISEPDPVAEFRPPLPGPAPKLKGLKKGPPSDTQELRPARRSHPRKVAQTKIS